MDAEETNVYLGLEVKIYYNLLLERHTEGLRTILQHHLCPQSISSRRLCPSILYHRIESSGIRIGNVVNDEDREKYVGSDEESSGPKDACAWSFPI